MTIDTDAALATAGATFLAVIVALFGPGLSRRHQRPILNLYDKMPDVVGADAKVVTLVDDQGTGYAYLRLAIINEGRTSADDASVTLIRFNAPRPNRGRLPYRDMTWADANGATTLDLPPLLPRLIDVALLKIERHRIVGVVPAVEILSSADNPEPGSRTWHEPTAGEYTARIALNMTDRPSTFWEVSFRIEPGLEAADVLEAAVSRHSPGGNENSFLRRRGASQ